MATTCNAPRPALFSTTSGHGIPIGLYRLHGILPNGEKCERYGEDMSYEEARAEGIRQGMLVWFRDTNAFIGMCKTFLKRYGPEKIREMAVREEMDFDELMKKLEE